MPDMTKDELVLSKSEQSTLLYLETRLVDYGGRVDMRRMNSDDVAWVRRMSAIGFIGFGRIVLQDHNSEGTNWVTFSDEAWKMAHHLRREIADRGLSKRQYRTTQETSSTVRK